MAADSAYPPVRLLVLNYNGRRFLEEIIPPLLDAVAAYPGSGVLCVVDNSSTDESVQYLQQAFPQVGVIREENRFLFSFNHALQNITEPIAVLMNNDVRVDKNFLRPLIDHFKTNDPVFAVGPRQIDWASGAFQQGALAMETSLTDIRIVPLPDTTDPQECTSLSGCCFAVDVEKFRMLGGFDELFAPFYFEETDLFFRAIENGWRCIYEPASVVAHYESASIDLFANQNNGKQKVYWMNRIKFLLRHLPGRRLYVLYRIKLGLQMIKFAFLFDWRFFPTLKAVVKFCERECKQWLGIKER